MKKDFENLSLELLKEMNAIELLELIAYAKKADDAVIKTVSLNTVKDAQHALEWFIEALEDADI